MTVSLNFNVYLKVQLLSKTKLLNIDLKICPIKDSLIFTWNCPIKDSLILTWNCPISGFQFDPYLKLSNQWLSIKSLLETLSNQWLSIKSLLETLSNQWLSNFYLHHMNKLRLECRTMCFFLFELSVKRRPQISQANGFSPVCILMCTWRPLLLWNIFWQILHWWRFSVKHTK